jgi:hypothetical protein
MPSLKLFFCGLVLTTLGCAADAPNVGGECSFYGGGCNEGLKCLATYPGGYCTQACATPGSTSECPEGAVCDKFSDTAITCAKMCKTAEDCRLDLDCLAASGSSYRTCKLKL